MKLRSLYSAGAAFVLSLAIGMSSGVAQEKPKDFPVRPINLVVMYPAGGAVDVTARTFADIAKPQLGHDFRVENRVGGAGMVGHTYLAKGAAADGYTIGVIANPFLFTDILLRDASFTVDEFEPIASISFDPVIWVVNAKSDIGSMDFDGIIEYAGQNTLQVGMNPNSVFLFVSEFIERSRNVKFNFIPFDGGRAGVTALLAGDIDATAAFYSEIEQYVRNGDLKPVAVTGENRHPMLPDTPTLNEVGVPAGGQAWGATRFFALPKGVPEDRKRYLEQALLQVLESDAAKDAFTKAGLTLTPADAQTSQENYRQTFEVLKEFLDTAGRTKN
ncbi:tripartite tricarboxylate transporter substrate binding protein [Telmatospirillum sp. J64-1]|uniref:tripartite tricarboxylate transporter substrate binding protein n=1 Tax=Telmatospirillum sp. J64-1 TaxID=2502183 RepID=UPI00163D98EA|nr:tripartite tricarboxylate transporter substrate binding protein [Telmatospirillum sp. J64-1]